jgi:hypothetical protein
MSRLIGRPLGTRLVRARRQGEYEQASQGSAHPQNVSTEPPVCKSTQADARPRGIEPRGVHGGAVVPEANPVFPGHVALLFAPATIRYAAAHA